MAKRDVRPHFRTTRSGKRVPVQGHKRRARTAITWSGILTVALIAFLLWAVFGR